MKIHICASSLLLTLAFSCLAFASTAQDQSPDQRTVNQWVNNRQFAFTPQTVTPLGGGIIQLNYPFYLEVKPDSIAAYLPYFGRAFTAPLSTQEAGLTFGSKDFSYEVTKSDKDKAEVTIQTRDQRFNYTLYLTLFSNGQSQLNVTSPNRQAIQFGGYVTEKARK